MAKLCDCVINAFTVSDRVLIPVAQGYFELDSIVQISKTVQEVREYFNPQITLVNSSVIIGRRGIGGQPWYTPQ